MAEGGNVAVWSMVHHLLSLQAPLFFVVVEAIVMISFCV